MKALKLLPFISCEQVYHKIQVLETLIYPGHDYRGFTSSTVALERKLNPRLGGGRSGQATAMSVQLGYSKTYNMLGGMLRWNQADLPVG